MKLVNVDPYMEIYIYQKYFNVFIAFNLHNMITYLVVARRFACEPLLVLTIAHLNSPRLKSPKFKLYPQAAHSFSFA